MRPEPVEAAAGVWRERYAEARVVFLAGSVLRGEATPTSDLDLVVVYESLPRARREAFVHAGWPVEAFVNDPETVNHYFEENRRRGIPGILRMVLDGIEVPAASDFSARLKRRAARVYEAGPRRWDEGELRHMRFRLTDWVDDIRHPRSPEELVATGAYLYQDLADFFLRSRGLWSAHSKTIPRRLREVDAAFAEDFRCAFESLFAEKRQGPAIALVEQTLRPFGGLLFDGWSRDAPLEDRKPLDSETIKN
ncbi:MAG TPA: nucleotidyltransferase domain-containing protein [Pyrinomonadaceae bacterium]|nr:nucleotidyltransferase domain-containing protein [Pyrinomonadaceae bacterium]